MKLKTKLTVLLLAVMIPASIGIAYLVYVSNRKTLQSEIKHRLITVALHVMDKVDRNLYARLIDLEVLAADAVISSPESTAKEITQRLIKHRNQYKTYASLSFFNLDRVRIADTAGLQIGRRHRPGTYWENFTRDQAFTLDISTSLSLQRPVIHFVGPVKDSQQNIFGVLVARMPLARLYEITRQAEGLDPYPVILKIDLVDKDGLLIYSNYNRKGMLKDNLSDYQSFQAARSGQAIGSLIEYDPIKDERDLFVFVRQQGYSEFRGSNWTLLLHVPTKVAFAPAVRLRNTLITILTVVIALIIVIALVFSHSITEPVTRLKNAAAEIGAGKLDTKIDLVTKDEIGQLAASFNKMTQDLKAKTISIDDLNREIAERKRAEEKIANLARFPSENPNPVLRISADGAVLYSNKAGETFIACPGRRCSPEEWRQHVCDVLTSGHPKQVESQCDGAIYSLTFAPVVETGYVNIYALDITKRKKAEQEREKLFQALESKNKELQDVVYIASHDLRTPLVNVQGFSGELAKTCQQLTGLIEDNASDELRETITNLLDRDIPESLRFIAAGTTRMELLLDGLLKVSRIGTVQLDIKTLDVNAICSQVINEMRFQIQQSQTSVTLEKLPRCLGDSGHISQLFTNLIGNALKYISPDRKGMVRISGKKQNSKSIYCVEDNGIGIAPDHQNNIFEMFHRLNPEDSAGGEGLGLTIVKRILDYHNGEIRLESEEGKGSKFFVSLPSA